MKTGIKVDFVFVLLLSLFTLSSYGANVGRGKGVIGGAIVGGIVQTHKAIYHGVAGAVGAAIETGNKSRNVTEVDTTATKSSGSLEDNGVVSTTSEKTSTEGKVAPTLEEDYNDVVKVHTVEGSSDGTDVSLDEEGSGSEVVSDTFEGMSVNKANAGDGVSDVEVETTTTEEGKATLDNVSATDSSVGGAKGSHNGFKSGSEGHLKNSGDEKQFRQFGLHPQFLISNERDYSRERYDFSNERHDFSNEFHDFSNERFDEDDGRYDSWERHSYENSGCDDADDYECRRHVYRGMHRRSKRGVDKTVEAAVVNKTDGSSLEKSKTSGNGEAIVGGVSSTAKTVTEGLEDAVDAVKESATTTTTTTSKPEKKDVFLNSTCKSQDICYADSECNGGKCVGAFVGTCNCNACFNFMTCTSDEGCGGLKGACDMTTKRCNCHEAQRKLGFSSYIDALTRFCNHQSCNATSDSCNGLPCTSGRCFC